MPKTIADPIHGQITLDDLEVSLIDTPTFQRLRYIKQLALAHLIYPNANHNRFSHSLGAFSIMRELTRILSEQHGHWKKYENLLAVVALLHDIGHYPYSHLMEKISRPQITNKLIVREGEENHPAEAPPVAPYPKHEEYSSLIVQQREDIIDALKRSEIDPAEVAAAINGNHHDASLNNLIHSTLDVDRLDYLLRDSHHAGIPYGKVDVHYLLNGLRYDPKENRLVFPEKARSALEHFILGRYHMFNVLYYHKTIMGFEALLRKILSIMREEGKIYRGRDEINEIVPTDKFLLFHDGYIDSLIEKISMTEKDSILGRLCRCLVGRIPPLLLRERLALIPWTSDAKRHGDINVLEVNKSLIIDTLKMELGIPEEFILWEAESDVLIESLGPTSRTTNVDDQEKRMKKFYELINIEKRDGEIIKLIDDDSSIVGKLADQKLCIYRIFVVVDQKLLGNETRKAFRDKILAGTSKYWQTN